MGMDSKKIGIDYVVTITISIGYDVLGSLEPLGFLN